MCHSLLRKIENKKEINLHSSEEGLGLTDKRITHEEPSIIFFLDLIKFFLQQLLI